MANLSLDSLLGGYLRLHGFKSRYFKTSLGQLHYFEKRVQNSKGTLAFVHGIGASSAHFERVLIPLCKSGYSILAVDLPGHGQSSEIEGGVSPSSILQSLEEWLNQVAGRDFILIGNSLGASLCLQYTIFNPDRPAKVIVTSPAGGFETEKEWSDFRKLLSFDSVSDSKKMMSRLYHRNPIYLPLIYPFFYQTMNRKGVRELLSSAGYEHFQLDREVPENFPPTLFIWGQSERLFAEKNLQWFKRVFPKQVQFEHPEKMGHCPHLENPKWFRNRIVEFLN